MKTGSSSEYLGPRGMRMGSGEGSTMRNFIVCTVIKSRRLRWTGHVARMEEGRSAFKILTGKSTGKKPESGTTILEQILKKYVSIRGI